MKKSILILVLCVSISTFSQKRDKVLLTIDGEKIRVSEFKGVYEKNLDIIKDNALKKVKKNLDLFIDFKLKVKEAYRLNLDTLPSFKKEINSYKNQLSALYLQDTVKIHQLVKDAYFRTKNEVKAKHIMIRVPKESSSKDTLEYYNKILEIRDRALKGEDFETLASEFSDDFSARNDPKTGRIGNGGNLGYFTAFRMLFPFEEVAFSTEVGKISLPFKTKFGYHIIKVDDIRKSKGKIQAAHILVKDTTSTGKRKIDEVYSKLLANEDFKKLAKEYSEDQNSSKNGGNLGKFNPELMPKTFKEACYSLTQINSFSKPFKTRFGWHIVKLLQKHPVKPFAEMKKELEERVKNSDRIKMSKKAVVNKLKKSYNIKEHEEAKNILDRKDIFSISKDSLQSSILSINKKNFTQEEFINYAKGRKHLGLTIFDIYNKFIEDEIINYYRENLENEEPEYARTIKEYKEGLLIFEFMQQKVWNKSIKDSIGLKQYFEKNISKYPNVKLEENRGVIVNDYQSYLEKHLIDQLRKNSKIKVYRRRLKRLVRFYEKS